MKMSRRRRHQHRYQSMRISHTMCKAIVVMIILEGVGLLTMTKVEGASRQSQQSSFGGDGNGGNDSNGWSMNGFNTFGTGSGGSGNAGAGTEGTKRMRDRCGRFSLLRVLQQWENLQKRCRLGYRDNSHIKGRDRYEYVTGTGNSPPSPSAIDDITIGKRSDHLLTYREGGGGNIVGMDDQYINHYYEVNGDALESCCPVVFEVIAPIYGRNRSGHMVELYKDENVQQKFYEYRCHKDYMDRPCRFVDGQHSKISKCVQQYLDTYALVHSDTSQTGWSMEHIRVASGCACKVDRVKASRRRKKVFGSNSHQQRGNSNNNMFLNGGGSRIGSNSKKRSRASSTLQQFRSSIFDY